MANMSPLVQWRAAVQERIMPYSLRSSEGTAVTVVGSLQSVAQRMAATQYQPRSPRAPSESRSGFTLMC